MSRPTLEVSAGLNGFLQITKHEVFSRQSQVVDHLLRHSCSSTQAKLLTKSHHKARITEVNLIGTAMQTSCEKTMHMQLN